MKRLAFTPLIAVLLLLAAPAVYGATVHLNSILLPTNEVPPTASSGVGAASMDLDLVAQTLQLNIAFTGLTSGTTASHIHCCLPSPLATGVNVGVATTTPTFAGFPLGVTSGTYNATLDLTQASSYNPAFITLEGSLAAAEAALINGLLNGLTYLNIHTSQFPGGEIRGFVVTAVPEPQTSAMLMAGLALFGFIAVRRNRR